jgi:hypothetical protein
MFWLFLTLINDFHILCFLLLLFLCVFLQSALTLYFLLLLSLILYVYFIILFLFIFLFYKFINLNFLVLLLIALKLISLDLIFLLNGTLLLIAFFWTLNDLCVIDFKRIHFANDCWLNLFSLFQLLFFLYFLFSCLNWFFSFLTRQFLFINLNWYLFLILFYRIFNFICCIFLRRFLRFLSFRTCFLIILSLIFNCQISLLLYKMSFKFFKIVHFTEFVN